MAFAIANVLKDAPLWYKHHYNHPITRWINRCMLNISDEELKFKLQHFMTNAHDNIKLFEEEYDKNIRQNSSREAEINHHTSNVGKRSAFN